MEIPHKIPIDFQRGILKVSIRNWHRDIHTTFPLILKGIPYCFNIEFGQRLSKLKFYWCRKKFLNACLWELGVPQTNFSRILRGISQGFHMEIDAELSRQISDWFWNGFLEDSIWKWPRAHQANFLLIVKNVKSKISYGISNCFWKEVLFHMEMDPELSRPSFVWFCKGLLQDFIWKFQTNFPLIWKGLL